MTLASSSRAERRDATAQTNALPPAIPKYSGRVLLFRGSMVLVLAFLLWKLFDVVLLVFAAVLLAVLLRGAAELLARFTRLPAGLCVGLVVLIIAGLVAGFGWTFGPRFLTEGEQLVSTLQSYAQHVETRYAQNYWMRMFHRMTAGPAVSELRPLTPELISMTFGSFGGLALLLITALYFAATPGIYITGIVLLAPSQYRARTREILRLLARSLRFWMLGQLVDMAVVAVLATTGLFLLHVPLCFALGLLAGALTFIPYIGAPAAGIPALIVASTVSLSIMPWVVVIYIGCHLIEGYIVSPLISRRTVRLPPAITILSMALLGEFYSFLGVLVATPLTVAAILLVKEIYVRDILKAPEWREGEF